MKKCDRKNWSSVLLGVVWTSLVWATIVVAAPSPAVGQSGSPCLDEVAADLDECLAERDSWLGDRACEVAAALRALACFFDPS